MSNVEILDGGLRTRGGQLDFNHFARKARTRRRASQNHTSSSVNAAGN